MYSLGKQDQKPGSKLLFAIFSLRMIQKLPTAELYRLCLGAPRSFPPGLKGFKVCLPHSMAAFTCDQAFLPGAGDFPMFVVDLLLFTLKPLASVVISIIFKDPFRNILHCFSDISQWMFLLVVVFVLYIFLIRLIRHVFLQSLLLTLSLYHFFLFPEVR